MLNPKAPIFEVPEELRGSILTVFQKESQELISDMKQAVQSDNIVQLKACAHKLKGSCGTIGATNLWEIATAIEDSSQIESGMVEEAESSFRELSSYISNLS